VEILVCVKRVPGTGSSITLTADGQAVDTRHLAFTIGPHEECAVEEAVRIVAAHGGSVTVLAVGPPEVDEQLRYALSMGADRAVRVEARVDHGRKLVHDGGLPIFSHDQQREVDTEAAAAAIVQAVGELETSFDLVLFGNESADAGNYQVGIRVAHALGLPIVGGVKGVEVGDGHVRLHRQVPDGVAVYEAALPAAAAVKEGLNLPRYPSMRGRLRAAKAQIRTVAADVPAGGLRTLRLRLPAVEKQSETVQLGNGADAAPAVVDLLEELL
jgi:electron transfer flavoprotein beta subunit